MRDFVELLEEERKRIETEFSNAVYTAVGQLFEREEAAGHMIGNGHHAAQNACSHVIAELRNRWFVTKPEVSWNYTVDTIPPEVWRGMTADERWRFDKFYSATGMWFKCLNCGYPTASGQSTCVACR